MLIALQPTRRVASVASDFGLRSECFVAFFLAGARRFVGAPWSMALDALRRIAKADGMSGSIGQAQCLELVLGGPEFIVADLTRMFHKNGRLLEP
ncbi:hypothetical protein [Pseudomonas sp.]|uniref:hypothetical protein n=1 Tax=Pseudomonas sp. TaxID=306 RepID=UPI003267F28A